MSLGLVGKGRAGVALHNALMARDEAPRWWWSRRDDAPISALPEVDIVVIAVADRAIVSVAKELAERASATREIWLHISGSLPGDAIRVSPKIPLAAGAMHPLCALDGRSDSLKGCVAGIDGDALARETGAALAGQMEMLPLPLEGDQKPLYHAAAVTVAGHAVALFSQAVDMLAACGIEDEMAARALLPLMRSAIEKLEHLAPREAMTGPVPRGDSCTVSSHLQAMDELRPDAQQTYRHLARTALRLMQGKIENVDHDQLADVLDAQT